MIMKRIYLFLLFLLGWYTIPVRAQIPEGPQALPSPNVASLGLYGEVPVSLFTGMPQISIPIYSIQHENFTIPISLSYHAGGINPDQHPGWTGLGWSLNSGGVIHRVVKDGPDESNLLQKGFYKTYGDLDKNNWNALDNLRSVAQTTELSAVRDTEPDEFIFSFLDYKGKFMLDHKKQWCVQCDKPIKVVFDDEFLELPEPLQGEFYNRYQGHPTFKNFTLITEDGIKYTFGGSESSIEYSINFFGQSLTEWVPTSWYLTCITMLDGTKINYSYEHREFVSQMYFSFIPSLMIEAEDGGFFDPSCSGFHFTNDVRKGYQGQLLYPTYLKKIVFPEGEIDFNVQETTELKYPDGLFQFQYQQWSESGSSTPFLEFINDNISDNYQDYLEQMKWYKLNRIIVKSTNKKIVRDIEFTYNDNPNQRLMLDGIEEAGGRHYHLKYNHPEKLPDYLSLMVDHWGFYNATSIGNFPNNYYEKREPNPSVALFGILEKIEYPTGGYTRFIFEPHTYRRQVKEARWEGYEDFNEDKIAGGVRIQHIITSETGKVEDEIITKSYFYTSEYVPGNDTKFKSSGVLGKRFRYSFSYKVESFSHNQGIIIDVFSTQSVLPGCNNEHYIGYTDVIEKLFDGSYTHYKFTNHDNGYLDAPADAIIQRSYTAYQPCISKAMERGKVMLLENYNSVGKLISKKEFKYVKTPSPDNYVRTINARYVNPCGSTFYDEGTAYKVLLYNFFPESVKEYSYDDSEHPLVVTTTYAYDSYGQLLSKKINQIGGSKSTLYLRPYSYTNGEYEELIDNHIISSIIEQIEDVTLGKEVTVYRKFADYRMDEGVLYLASLREQWEEDDGWKNSYQCHVCYKGHPIYVTEDDTDVVYFWNTTTWKLIAEIRNASLEDVEGVLGNIDFDRFELNRYMIHVLRVLLPQAHITSYSYEPLVGITSVTDEQGLHTYYEYDSLGRVQVVRDEDGEVVQVYDYQYKLTD